MRGYVYLIGSERFKWYKIGKARRPEIRIRDLGILLPFKIRVFAVWQSEDCDRLESRLHQDYSEYNINGEWFHFANHKVREIVHEDLVYLHRVYLAGEDHNILRFSNSGGKVGRNRPLLSPIECEQRKQMSIAKRRAVLDWLSCHNLPDTPDNRRIARTQLLDLSSPVEASSAPASRDRIN